MNLIYILFHAAKHVVNCFGRVIHTLLGIQLYSVTYDRILCGLSQDARKMVEQDGILEARLRLICDYVEHDQCYSRSLVGRFLQATRLKTNLNQHAAIHGILLKEPDIHMVQIVKPIFIINLPRTGSNLLARIMGCDHQYMLPNTWELLDTDNLKERQPSETLLSKILLATTNHKHMHATGLDITDDALVMMERRVINYLIMLLHPQSANSLWHGTTNDLRRDCDALKQMLQVIIAHQHQGMSDRRVVVKIHAVGINLTALLDVFPDAQLVMVHRNCSKVVPSAASLLLDAEKTYVDRNPEFYAHQVNWFLGRCGAEVIKQREAVIAERSQTGKPVDNVFIDFSYTELTKDTLGTLQKLYTKLGLQLTPEVKQSMQTWLENNRHDKYGRHVYSLEQFRLTQDDINREWRDYQEHFKQYL